MSGEPYACEGRDAVKSENVLMSAWYNGYADPKEMIKQGYDLISIPDGYLYNRPRSRLIIMIT